MSEDRSSVQLTDLERRVSFHHEGLFEMFHESYQQRLDIPEEIVSLLTTT